MPVYLPLLRRLLPSGLQEFLDAAIISGAGTSSSEEPGTSTAGVTPHGPRTFMGGLVLPPCWITPDFLNSLALPADCLIAGNLDTTCEAEAGSDS